jgi:hypothetical protein
MTKKRKTAEGGNTTSNRREFLKQAAVAATTAFTAGQLIAHEKTGDAGPSAWPKTEAKCMPRVDRTTKDEFKPGDKVPTSGIYNVIHDRLDGDAHAHPHHVVAIAGKLFPPCRVCREWVRFHSHEAAEYVEAHDLFSDSEGGSG